MEDVRRMSAEVAIPGAIGRPREGVMAREEEAPVIELPRVPEVGSLWLKSLVVAWLGLAYFFWDRGTFLFMNYWLLDRLGFESVFWTNFRMGASLFAIAFVLVAGAIAAPALLHDVSRRVRLFIVQGGLLIGLLAGYWLSLHYMDFLLLFHAESFGIEDPVFHQDNGFYFFQLPAIWDMVHLFTFLSVMALVASVFCAHFSREQPARDDVNRGVAVVGRLATPYTLVALGAVGVAVATELFFSRYGLLTKDNTLSSVYRGAEYVDVAGFFSTLNMYYVSAGVALVVVAAAIFVLWTLRKETMSPTAGAVDWRRPLKIGGAVMALFIAMDFAFAVGVAIRDRVAVTPNEPVIQLEYIQRHIDATREAYGLNAVEEIPFLPKEGPEALADPEALLESPTLRNVSLWPGFTSHLERVVDPEYVARLDHPGGAVVLNTSLQAYQQQESLRPYYDFLDVDTIRYTLDGETKVLTSAVREIPIYPGAPWLAVWGQLYVLLTHGYGLVIASVSESTPEGEPVYLMNEIPPQTTVPELQIDNPSIYYGEGSEVVAFSQVNNLAELDYPTEQGRAEVVLPPEDATSVKIDNFLKRLVFSWRSGQFSQIFFSTLIDSDTHIHFNRPPIPRAEAVAPFLFYDSDPFAFVADGEILWMINGMTTSNTFPYSMKSELGDKSVVRTPERRPARDVNYVRDSVKITVNASSGEVTFYKIMDEPVVNAWSRIYPDLFVDGDEMPESVRSQMQYPPQLFHTQFDDMYIYYHMDDPITFFNLEDLWDDADEVIGPMFLAGAPVNFSVEPYYWVAETGPGSTLPESSQPTQFVQSQVFTPEGSLNLRAIATVYQDGDDYGRLVVQQVPKGHFYLGPEQAEAAIDQEPEISQQIDWWNRLGTEVIRGAISTIVIDGEVIYVEPLFIRSEQLQVPQLKRVAVVYRGVARMGFDLPDALRRAVTGERSASLVGTPIAPGETAEEPIDVRPEGGGPPPGVQ